MLVRRIFAFLIDIALAYLLNMIPFIGWLAALLFILLRDGLTRQGSPGKNLLNLDVASFGSHNVYEESARRNIIFAVPFFFSVIPIAGAVVTLILLLIAGIIETVIASSDPQGLRYGDHWANTRVKEARTDPSVR